MKEALEFHVQGMIEDGNEVPQWLVEGDYEFKWCLKDTASLLQSFLPDRRCDLCGLLVPQRNQATLTL